MSGSTQLEPLISQSHEEDTGADIILLHGLPTRSAVTDVTKSWAPVIRSLSPEKSNLLGFNVGVPLGDPDGWNLLWARSSDLLEAVYDYHQSTKMLWKATQQFSRFRDIIELISGVVFLATPHFTKSDEESAKALSTVLRTDLSLTSKQPFTKLNLSSLVNTSLHFEELRMQIPVLSGFETVETKLRSSFWVSRKAILVPRQLVETSAPFEVVIPIDLEREKIFHQPDCVFHLRLREYLRKAAMEAWERIEKVLKAQKKSTKVAVSDLRSKTSVSEIQFEERQVNSEEINSTPNNWSSSPERKLSSQTGFSSSLDSMQTTSSRVRISNSLNSGQKEVNLPCRISPYSSRNLDFRGREQELKTIHEALCPASNLDSGSIGPAGQTLKTFVIHGPAGIGKTQLAVEYMFTYWDTFDAIFYLSASQPDKLLAGYTQIALKLGLELRDTTDDQAASRELVKAWLADPVKSRPSFGASQAKWLMILDNADDPGAVLDNDFWPREGRGSVLVTSQDPISKSALFFGETGMELNGLAEDEAASLLRALSHQSNDVFGQVAGDIVKKLNYYPLAIVQMAGIIRRRTLSFADFLEIYSQQTERPELHDLRVGTLHGYGSTLRAIWSLTDFELGPKQILSVATFLEPDSIAEEIFTTAPQDSLPGFPQNKSAFLRGLSTLTQCSIISRNLEGNSISIHRMVQDVIRSQLLNDDDSLVAAFGATVKLVCSVWPFITTPRLHPVFDQIDRYSQCERLVPHLVCMREMFQTLDEAKQERCATADFAWLLAEGAWYHMERSNPKECLASINAGFHLTEVASEDLTSIRAELHGTRSSIGLEMNETDVALYHREENVAFREKAYAQDGKLTSKLAAGYSEYGRALMTCGLYSKAAEMFEKSIEIRKKLPGFKRIQLFNPLRGLALVRWKAGKFDEASDLLLGALRDREIAFGRDDKKDERTGELLYSLGTVRRSQNLLNDSFDYHQRAFLQFESTIGLNHYLTAKACYTLAMHYVRFKEYDNAIMLLEKACMVNNRGQYYTADLARSTFQLGRVQILQGHLAAGQESLNRAWSLRHQLVTVDLRPIDQLQDADFDELVTFWSV